MWIGGSNLSLKGYDPRELPGVDLAFATDEDSVAANSAVNTQRDNYRLFAAGALIEIGGGGVLASLDSFIESVARRNR